MQSPDHSVSGQSANVFKVRRAGDDLRFVSLKEQRLRE
jgi:hypothetical protein